MAMFGSLVTVMSGMLYKIMPFLAWLHVQNHGARLGRRRLPHMGSYLSGAAAWLHFGVHAAAIAALLLATWKHSLLPFAGFLMLSSFAVLAFNQLRIVRRYRAVLDELRAGGTGSSASSSAGA
jgi:hypothetical protein